jgi:predicted secreted protein
MAVANGLAITHPDLAAEWHPAKNGDLTPFDVVAGTGKKIWWKCPKGRDHEWRASGHNRVGGTGCPACAGQQVSVTNSLANYPALAAQWHPTKNGDLTPNDVTARSDKTVWWMCPLGPDHEWQTSCGSRTNLGSGCPFCTGRRACAANNMAITHPVLAAQWHPTKNGGLLPTEVVAGTGKQIWWFCTAGKDCPFCANRRPMASNNMAVTHPALAAEWHPTKNGELRPEDVVASTTRQIWWVCDKDPRHEWRTSGSKRVLRDYGCPSCSNQRLDDTNSMATTHPQLAAEWHPTKNGDLRPTDVIAGTNRKIWWKCEADDEHEWCVTGNRRTSRNSGCLSIPPLAGHLE